MLIDVLTVDHLRELLSYDPETGVFRWLVSRGRVRAGNAAGCLNMKSRHVIKIDGKMYGAGRLAWLYMTGEWPPVKIDHRDRDPSNTVWTNLRPATTSQNSANMLRKNKSGFKGVARAGKRWSAKIVVNGKAFHLGTFDTAPEAHAAYKAAAEKHFGEFARAA